MDNSATFNSLSAFPARASEGFMIKTETAVMTIDMIDKVFLIFCIPAVPFKMDILGFFWHLIAD